MNKLVRNASYSDSVLVAALPSGEGWAGHIPDGHVTLLYVPEVQVNTSTVDALVSALMALPNPLRSLELVAIQVLHSSADVVVSL
jgi:hypothetical protein